MFTVVCKNRVLRVRAKSVQHLTQALNGVGISFLAIHEDVD